MAYIPKQHLQYDVLPSCRANGGEVFHYPKELGEIEDLLWTAEHAADGDESERTCLIAPYGYETYDEYFNILRIYAEKHKGTGLERRLLDLIDETRALNVKEEWSVVRYLGSDLDDDPDSLASNLTKGRCYYWPCSAKDPRYNGVIDDEEFTSYLYPCDKECWEVLADPTGIARRALDGEPSIFVPNGGASSATAKYSTSAHTKKIGGTMDRWIRVGNYEEDTQYVLQLFWEFHDFRIQNINYSPEQDRVDLVLEYGTDGPRLQLRFTGISDFNFVPSYDYPSDWLIGASLFITDSDEFIWVADIGVNREDQVARYCTWVKSKELHFAGDAAVDFMNKYSDVLSQLTK